MNIITMKTLSTLERSKIHNCISIMEVIAQTANTAPEGEPFIHPMDRMSVREALQMYGLDYKLVAGIQGLWCQTDADDKVPDLVGLDTMLSMPLIRRGPNAHITIVGYAYKDGVNQPIYWNFRQISKLEKPEAMYAEHARQCGVDMEGKDAVPLLSAYNRVLASPVIDPVTCEVVYPVGRVLTQHEVRMVLFDLGLDYLICYKA
jgi:hypothetical protein